MALSAERSDPVRNFKFHVQATGFGGPVFGRMGFMSVEGLSMTTDMVAYREGGFNTTPHKLPGQTDFSPLTLSSGVFFDKPEMWRLAKKMFSFQHGNGALGFSNGQIDQYRYTLEVRVMGHPVTKGAEANPQAFNSGAVLGFKFYNCWTGSVGFSGLNAQDNSIMIHQMQVHHEGFETFFGNAEAIAMTTPTAAHAGTYDYGSIAA